VKNREGKFQSYHLQNFSKSTENKNQEAAKTPQGITVCETSFSA
jgi:hypothetical protein